ncbi:MAG: polysaccharide deacetylase family protein [Gammaproteobacteria bacterium]
MDNKSLVVSFDLEDHRPDPSFPKRYPDITRRLLDLLEARGIRATVFVLGRLARETPELIREIAARGHEVGYHSAQHVHLTQERPDKFLAESREDLKFITDLTGSTLLGYRAPAFSLTPKSRWAIDAINELGFKYSSSVMPVKNPINGFPGAPRRAFFWPNGLLEIPAPVADIGPISMPFLGGIYLRYLPTGVIKRLLKRNEEERENWIYCHPHDFDHEERFFQIEGTSYVVSLLLWFNRRGTFTKLMGLLPESLPTDTPQTFGERISAGVYRGAPHFAVTGL